MPARKASSLHPRHRDAIQTAQLVRRLQSFAMGGPCHVTGLPFVMTREQVAAALGLLKKTLPDLQGTTIDAGSGGGGFVIMGTLEAPTVDAWQEANPVPGADL